MDYAWNFSIYSRNIYIASILSRINKGQKPSNIRYFRGTNKDYIGSISLAVMAFI